MKRLHTIMAAVAAMLATLTLTGCTEDESIANNLWGVWEGNMYVESYYNGRTYSSQYSVLAFDKDPYSYAQGSGYWIDYYSNAPWNSFSSRIEWRVVNSEIQIYSVKENCTYYIYDYRMTRNYFTGYLDTGNGSSVYFQLQKTSSPDWSDYGWDGYDWGYGYGYGSGGYNYAPASSAASKSVTERPVRRIRRD